MTLVVDKFRTLLPPRTKSSPSGWLSFNAPCCQHRGHKADTRKRAGVRFDGEGIVYNCFNCKFTTGWLPGNPLGEKMKSLLKWMGAPDDIIREMTFEALKTENETDRTEVVQPKIEFTDKDLPEGSISVADWIQSDLLDDVTEYLDPVIDYIHSRGMDPLSPNFYWSPAAGYTDRVIIPFLWEGRIVGNTARKIKEGRPKYLSDQHPNFVFNFDKQTEGQRYTFVCEGPFDALSIGGLALLTNDVSDQQSRIINSLNSEIILVPDQDKAGLSFFDRAMELGWSVAMPTWETDVKDCADAVARYGKLFVITDLIKTAANGSIKINMAKNQQKKKLEILEHEKNN